MEIVRRAVLALMPPIKAFFEHPMVTEVCRDRWIIASSSILVGSIAASLWPKVVGLTTLLLIIFVVVRHFIEHRRNRQRAMAYTAFELALRQPDSDALARMRAANEHFLVFNRVVELLPHYSLSSSAGFASLGWAPGDIIVNFQNENFDASEILTNVGGMKQYDPPNGRKFCLTDRFGTTDAALSLTLRESNYFTIRSVVSNLSFALRTEFGSLDPAKNQVPHSLCLHFIVRCADGSVLLLLNDTRKAYAGGTWSVSAEEQLKDSDLSESSPMDALFRRAVL